MRKLALVFSALFLGLPNIAMADMAQQVAQQQNRSQMDSVYQERLRAANTPEERRRIEAEYDRQRQQSAVPGHDHSDTRVLTGPGTARSGTVPSTHHEGSIPGESPTGGGAVPRGQAGD